MSEKKPQPDLINAEVKLITEPAVPNVENEKPPESSTENQPPVIDEATRANERERRRRAEIFSGVRPVWEMVSSAEFDDEKLMEYIAPWAKKFDCKAEDLAELLDYFELADKLIDKEFSAGDKTEIVCALAELVADGTLDAETLQSLAFRIVKGGLSGTMDRVCEYSENSPGIIVYDELLERNTNGKLKNNLIHILKHEVAHGLSRYGKIGHDEETQAKINQLIENSKTARSKESYRSINAIDQYLAVKNKEGATPEEIETKARWLAEELLAEKTTAYLQSGGELSGFLNAIWSVMPLENQKKLTIDDEAMDAWTEENRFFFDKIAGQMGDKSALKERVITSPAAGRARLAEHDSDDSFDYSEFFGGGFFEPAQPATQKSNNSSGEGFGSLVGGLGEVIKAVGSEFEKSGIPGVDMKM